MIPYEKDWIGLLAPEETASDPELLDLMVRSDLCVIYGTVKAITGRETRVQMATRRDALRCLMDPGIVVIATFALGWDDHDESVFDARCASAPRPGCRCPNSSPTRPSPAPGSIRGTSANKNSLPRPAQSPSAE